MWVRRSGVHKLFILHRDPNLEVLQSHVSKKGEGEEAREIFLHLVVAMVNAAH